MDVNKNKFLSNVSWIMLGRVTQLVLTFVTTMLITRYLGPTQYGIITYTYSYVALFLPICTLGLNDIVVKELLENKEKNDEILGTILSMRFLSSALSIGLIYVVVLLATNNHAFVYIALLQSLSLLFQIFDTIIYFYQSRLLAKNSGLILFASYVFTAIFRIIGLVANKSIEWFAFAVSLDYLVISALLLIKYFYDGNKLTFSIIVAKKLLKKSSHYIVSGIMIVIYSKADSIILGKMIDETTVGYYSAATTLCNAWPFILTAIIDSATPIIIDTYKDNKQEYKKKIKQLYATVFYISFVVAIGICLFARYIIIIPYGYEYIPSIIPLRIVCWSTIFAYLGVARSAWMQCENKLKYEALLSFFGAFFNVAINLIMIRNFGIIGASIALVITQFVTNVLFVYLIKGTRENAKLILDAIMLKGIK